MSSLLSYTEQSIEKISALLQAFRQRQDGDALQPLLQRWEAQIAAMRDYAQANAHVAIAFVGGTGAGKSTLINALLDADLLPTHSFRTCTSAAIEICHAARKTWRARLTFLPLSAWEQEKQLFLDEVAASRESGHSRFDYQDFLYKAWALYRPRSGQPPLPFPLDDLLVLLQQQALPDSVQNLLAQGELELKARSPEALKAELSQYLTAESPVWPMLQSVHIEGPLPVLEDGLHLIDLPGLNDPNPVREQITRRYLQQAELIWLIFGAGRGLTREVMELMQSQPFMRQIILDGKASALSFVGTRADDFVPMLERQILNLPDLSDEALYQVRNSLIQQQIQQQLSELTLWFSNRYKVSDPGASVLQLIGNTLQESPIYLTAALAYQGLQQGFAPAQMRLETPEQTGIPALREHMRAIVATHGIKARKKLVRSQFQQLNTEIRRLVERLKQRQLLQNLDQQRLATLSIQLLQLQQQARHRLQEIQQTLQQELKLRQLAFEKQWRYALADLQRSSPELLENWQGFNWQYLSRAVRHQGRYTSASTGVHLDLQQDVLALIEAEVGLDGYAFFQQDVLKELDRSHSLTQALLEQCVQQLQVPLAAHPELLANLPGLQTQGAAILQEQAYRNRQAAAQGTRQLQRQVGVLLETVIAEVFEPVFEAAAGLSGSGLKQEILNLLGQALQQLWPVLEQRLLAESLQPALNSLTDQLLDYQKALLESAAATLESFYQMMDTDKAPAQDDGASIK
ncbi:MAG: dynamin family protein [Candidatus Sericytochromatia bacterium]|nr:dynamin family protein [Candidatus Sericytochromatia bacterium]